MEQAKHTTYQLVTENPIIVLLVERLNKVYETIDDNKDALNQVLSLLSAVPNESGINFNEQVTELNAIVNEQLDEYKKEITNDEWSVAHAEEKYQQKAKQLYAQMYLMICNKVSSYIDVMYRKGLNNGVNVRVLAKR